MNRKRERRAETMLAGFDGIVGRDEAAEPFEFTASKD
jgi:hypothetical protein